MIGAIQLRIQAEVISILIVSVIIIALVLVMYQSVKKADPYQKPQGLALVAIMIVESLNKLTKDNVKDKSAPKYAPYIGVLAFYILLSNIIGLLGITQPTKNFSVTLTLALITFILIQRASIKHNGIGSYIKGFFDPHPLFFIMNFFGTVAPVVSMSVRLFGNITSGSIILLLVYGFTAYISSFIPIIGQINLIGPFIAPFLHFYFDLFVGAIQMFIFISLTTVFIGNELA